MSTREGPPLKGDRYGIYRVQIVGNSGVGKSTIAEELAHILNVPCIHLDAVFWKPNWGEPDDDEFQNLIQEILDSADFARGWVVDGDYSSRLGDVIKSQVTDLIWLDTPFLLYIPRILKRTFLRLFKLRPPCAPGCEENFANVFLSRKSIIWYCITRHFSVKRRREAMMRTGGVDVGGNMRRIGGWGKELAQWKEAVRVNRTYL